MSRNYKDLERITVLLLLGMFSVLAAASYILSFFGKYKPDATLTGIATAIVGASVTHLLITARNDRNGNGKSNGSNITGGNTNG